MSSAAKGYSLVLLSAIGFSIAVICARMAFVYFPEQNPFNVAFWGWFSAMLAVSFYFLLFQKPRQQILSVWCHDQKLMWLLGLCSGVGGIFWFFALAQMDAGIVSLFDQTIVIWSFLLSFTFLGERTRVIALLGIIVALIGLLLLAQLSTQATWFGVLCSLVATFNIAIQSVFIKKLSRPETDMIALTYLRGSFLVGFAGSIFFFWGKLSGPPHWGFIVLVFLSQIMGLFVARAAYMLAHNYLPVQTLSSLNLLIPVLTMVAGFLFLGEELTFEKIFGGTLIVFGLLWFMRFKSVRP